MIKRELRAVFERHESVWKCGNCAEETTMDKFLFASVFAHKMDSGYPIELDCRFCRRITIHRPSGWWEIEPEVVEEQ